jgi:hypothetical protein
VRYSSWLLSICGSAVSAAAQEGDCAFAGQTIQNKKESKMSREVVAQTSQRFYCTATRLDAAPALVLSGGFSAVHLGWSTGVRAEKFAAPSLSLLRLSAGLYKSPLVQTARA